MPSLIQRLPEEASIESELSQDDFKHLLITFTRLYSFLSQIMPFNDAELERLFPYVRFLQKNYQRKRLKTD